MNEEARTKATKAAIGALAMALMSIALPSEVRADVTCENGPCTVNGQPGLCGSGTRGNPPVTNCYCFQVQGTAAEQEPACEATPPL